MNFRLIVEEVLGSKFDVLFDDAKKRALAFTSTRSSSEGIVLNSWPKFFEYFEQFKVTTGNIDRLFLDFDIVNIDPAERAKHPLTPDHGFGTYKDSLEQIKRYREENSIDTPTDMLDYFPSGQGATEYLINNKQSLIPKIGQIVVHCSSNNNASIMVEALKGAGYANVIRILPRILNGNGFQVQ